MIEGIEEEKPIITTTHEKIDIDSKKSIWKLAAFHEQRREGGGEKVLARAWIINGIDHAPMARSNGG